MKTRAEIIEMLHRYKATASGTIAEQDAMNEIIESLQVEPSTKEYPFKCNKCGFEFTSDDFRATYLTCTQPFPQRTSGVCGGVMELNYPKKQVEPNPIRCKYVKREGESCTLNNNCTYPDCLQVEPNINQSAKFAHSISDEPIETEVSEMTLSQLRDKVITGSFAIGEGGIKEPVSGLGKSDWEFYANRLEEMILKGHFLSHPSPDAKSVEGISYARRAGLALQYVSAKEEHYIFARQCYIDGMEAALTELGINPNK